MAKKNTGISISDLSATDLSIYYKLAKELTDIYNNHCIANEDDEKAYAECLEYYNKYSIITFKLKEEIKRRLNELI